MKIVVLVKEVPDTYGPRRLDLETGLTDRGASESVLDEIAERSIEVALLHADSHPDTEVVLLSMSPASASASLRKGLAMGADAAIHIVDDGLIGADLGQTAEVIAAALGRIGFDLVIAGNLSTDGVAGALPTMVAEMLDVPSATSLRSVVIEEASVAGERVVNMGTMQISAPLPAIISITEQLHEGRFPSFKGIMAARKKPLDVLSLADLGVDRPDDDAIARSIVIAVTERPARQAGVKIIDEGDGGAKAADFLVANGLV